MGFQLVVLDAVEIYPDPSADSDIRRAVEFRGIGIDQHLLNAGRRRNEDCDVAVIVMVV